MQIDLPVELESFLEQEFATGRYVNKQEIIVQALHLLRGEREQALAGIRDGLTDVAAGRVRSVADVFTDIREKFELPGAE